jgi:hypothetical protein
MAHKKYGPFPRAEGGQEKEAHPNGKPPRCNDAGYAGLDTLP